MAADRRRRIADAGRWIVIEGARTHNLRGVDVRIPRGALTVVTGVSGSGKSSLAFDTLYAEGQRRYVESLSTYARQFLERMARPDVDHIGGVPPAIAIEQRNGVRNARSTVGTATEISDYLRLLYAAVGEVRCEECGGPAARDTATAATDALLAAVAGRRVQVVAEVASDGDGKHLDDLVRTGHQRLLLDGVVRRLDEGTPDLLELRLLPVLLDRLVVDGAERERIATALAGAFRLAGGRAAVHVEGEAEPRRFDEGHRCRDCGRALLAAGALTPARFSYNSPLGACASCQGFGRAVGIDLDKVIPDGGATLRGGAITVFQTPANQECQDDLVRACRRKKIPLDVAWRDLDEQQRRFVVDGEGDQAWQKGRWYGVSGFFRWMESKKYKMHVRVLLARYRRYEPCGACNGTRLRRESLSVLVGGRSIAALEALPIGALRLFLSSLKHSEQQRATACPVLAELDARLAYLEEVGLDYLTLIRQARTLSGGESQRIALASALGAQLTGTLYVLDEPSVGLHPRDADRLLGVLRRLVARGNTVVVVEHDFEIIAAADHILDLGPGAGARGGEVVFAGSYPELLRVPAGSQSRTAELVRRRSEPLSSPSPSPRASRAGRIRIVGARANNLRGVTADIPLGALTCVTGVSGSGKSTLVEDVLHAGFLRARGRPLSGGLLTVGDCDRIEGLDEIDDVVLVDQTPLGRSSRSNPATYLKAFDELRKLLGRTDEAKKLGLAAGAFSFNVAKEKGGGRCEVCAGQGTVTLEMHFLADVTVPCDACDGRRFGDRVLGVRLRGHNVNGLLALTVDEALELFADQPRLVARLRPFADVGLGYLTLGQSTATLSGGESQRLKLAAHLAVPSQSTDLFAGPRGSLFLLDEPTTGLHAADVEVLLAALLRLRQAGHTVVVVEHNLDFIRHADHLLDLGPEGGDGGGRLVAAGTPSAVARVARSHTGRALAGLEALPRQFTAQAK